MNPILNILRKERQGLLNDQRGRTWLLIYSFMLSAFALLLITNREMSLLDNAQIVYMMVGTITAAGAVIAVILGADAFAGECERHTLVPLLTAPITRNQLLWGKILGLLLSWGVLYLMALPYLWAVGAGGQNLLQAMSYLGLFGTPVVLAFGCLTMALSARTGRVLTALVSGLVILLFSASPLLIGPGLRNTVIGRAFDAVNPFAGALNTYDAVIIDSDLFRAQLSRLLLVWAGLVAALYVARLAARHPRFR